MNSLPQFLENGLLIRTITKRELRELDLVSLINSVQTTHPPYSLKVKAHLIEAFSDLLLRIVRLLLLDVNEFEEEHFYAQVKEKRLRTGNPTKRRKRKTTHQTKAIENNLADEQAETERRIDEAVSSKKNTADKKDINLPPRLPQEKSEDSQTSLNKLPKSDNFRDALNNLPDLPMPMPNDTYNDLAPIPPSAEKQYTFMDHLRKNIESDVSRLADEYKDLLETTAENSIRPTSIRKTRKKTVGKALGVTLDERINIATLIEDVGGTGDATETKRKQEHDEPTLIIRPIDLIAEELQSFWVSVRQPLLDETRNKFAELHRSIMLNESLSNTFLGGFSNFDMEQVRVDRTLQEGGDLMEFLTGKKSLSSRSESKSSEPSNERLKREGEIQIPNLSTILETNDAYSMSPSRKGEHMSSLQVAIVDMISANMQNGQVNLNRLIAERNPNRMMKAQLFVEVLGLNFKMFQERAESFGDIYISAE